VDEEVLTRDSRKLQAMTDSLNREMKDTHIRNHEPVNEFMEPIKLRHPILHQEVPMLVHPPQETVHQDQKEVDPRKDTTEEDKLESLKTKEKLIFRVFLYFRSIEVVSESQSV
jgi:hypothetical protein